MKSKHSFLFYFKIAKELSEFRNYLTSIIDTFFSIVNHYFYDDNDYITNWEVSRNDKLFSIVGNHAPTGCLHLYTDS